MRNVPGWNTATGTLTGLIAQDYEVRYGPVTTGLASTYAFASLVREVAVSTIIEQPQDVTDCTAGLTLSTSIAPTAYPVDYQWYSCTNASKANSQAIDGATASSFPIPSSLTPETDYFYYCIIEIDDAVTAPLETSVARVNIPAFYNMDYEAGYPTAVVNGAGAEVTVTVRLRNAGTGPSPAAFPVAFYGNSIASANRLGTGTASAIAAGTTGDATCIIPVTTLTNMNVEQIVVRFNDNGTYPATAECYGGDSVRTIANPAKYNMDYAVGYPTAVVNGANVNVTVHLTNVGAGASPAAFPIAFYSDAIGGTDKFLGSAVITNAVSPNTSGETTCGIPINTLTSKNTGQIVVRFNDNGANYPALPEYDGSDSVRTIANPAVYNMDYEAGYPTAVVNGTNVDVIVRLRNVGAGPSPADFPIALYSNTIGSAQKLANTIIGALAANVYTDVTYSIPVTTLTDKQTMQFVIRFNDNGVTYPVKTEYDGSDSVRVLLNPVLPTQTMNATLNGEQHNGFYANPVAVLRNEEILYTIDAVNANLQAGNVYIRDTLPAYLNYVAGSATLDLGGMYDSGYADDGRDLITWRGDGISSFGTMRVTFRATPAAGVCASQPLFINRAWVRVSDTIIVPTNATYHQGAGVAMVTFAASAGGTLYNPEPQAVDYRTSPRAGVLIVPDSGYAFAGWSHEAYYSLRGELVPPAAGILYYDSLTIYGNVDLRADFAPIRYPIRYYLHGGENAAANPPDYTVEDADVTLAPPTKEGDEFVGWSGSNGDDPQPSVTIPARSTGERIYYANYRYSGREPRTPSEKAVDAIWAAEGELYIRTSRAGAVVRIYTPDGILQRLFVVPVDGTTTYRLDPGLYIVTLNNAAGVVIRV